MKIFRAITEPLPELEAFLQKRLDAEERIVWRGMPRAQTFVVWTTAGPLFGVLIVFAGVLSSLALMGLFPIAQAAERFVWRVPVPGVVEIGIGLAILYWRIGVMRNEARKRIYLITQTRAIVVEDTTFDTTRTLYSYPREKLANLERFEKSDGSGDLIFEDYRKPSSDGEGFVRVRRGFVGIVDVRGVEKLLRESLSLEV